MRLQKYLMLFILMISYNVIAQDKDNTLLSDHLSNLENRYQITFSLDAELIKNITLSNADTSSLTKKDAIQKLSALVPFQFTSIDTENILILPIQASNTKVQIAIIDNENELIPGVLAKVKNKKITAVSNDKGLITIEGVLTPYDSVIFDGFGYNKVTYSIAQLQNNNEKELIITPEITQLEETIIEGYIVSGINSIVNDHSIQIKQNDLDIIPGQTSGDVLQSIAILPGISSPNTKAGNLFLRGSTLDQTLVYFDNIPLYNKGHFFGTISPFNQLAVEQVNVYRNGSHPRIGGRIGGTLEVKTTSELSDSASKAIGISMTDALAYVKAPIIKDRLDILISARHSLPSSLNTPRQESILDIINQDLSLIHI